MIVLEEEVADDWVVHSTGVELGNDGGNLVCAKFLEDSHVLGGKMPCNLPSRCSCMTISQPPINSPLT